jgi:hypothetical protein
MMPQRYNNNFMYCNKVAIVFLDKHSSKMKIVARIGNNHVLYAVTSAESPYDTIVRCKSLASTHVGSWTLTLGRLLASGRAGHDSVPRDDRPRGRCRTLQYC